MAGLIHNLLQPKSLMLSPQPADFSRPLRIASADMGLRQKEWSGSLEENIPWERMSLPIGTRWG